MSDHSWEWFDTLSDHFQNIIYLSLLCAYMNAVCVCICMAECLSMSPLPPSCLLVCAGETEVVQSRSEAAVSERDPLSQPVHCE